MPNMIGTGSIVGKTAVQQVGTSATAIVSNASSSGKTLKINALLVSNVDGTNDATVDVDLYRSSTAYYLVKTVNVPADTTLEVVSRPIYLEEGDSLRILASAASDLHAVCSYEEIG